jgi:hypothetical protein
MVMIFHGSVEVVVKVVIVYKMVAEWTVLRMMMLV